MGAFEKSGIVPWHMWGDTKSVRLHADNGPGLTGSAKKDAQFARISYARPETWSFILAATIVDQRNVIDGAVVQVYYDITLGVGRSQFTIPLFRQFTWKFGAGVSMIGQTCWSNSGLNRVAVEGQVVVVPVPVPSTDDKPNTLVAQDIQARAFASILSQDPTPGFAEVSVDISAFFAPRTHIRPEWFVHRFPGGEDKGS